MVEAVVGTVTEMGTGKEVETMEKEPLAHSHCQKVV